jgi:hypothetical protein
LRTYISDEDVNEEIEESKAFISEIKQEIEEDGDYSLKAGPLIAGKYLINF